MLKEIKKLSDMPTDDFLKLLGDYGFVVEPVTGGRSAGVYFASPSRSVEFIIPSSVVVLKENRKFVNVRVPSQLAC